MRIINYMETMVQEELDILLEEIEDICKCQKCRFDMMVWALNRIPPKYVVTDKGRLYTKLKEQEVQFRADVIRELTRSIIKISQNVQH